MKHRMFGLVGLLVALVAIEPAAAPAQVGQPAELVAVGTAAGHLTWLVQTSSGQIQFAYGVAGDVPVWGDWDGDGLNTPGVFRNGRWLLKNIRAGGVADQEVGFGQAGDVPLVGDWDSDGRVGLGLVRGREWLFRQRVSSGGAETRFVYGAAGDAPVVGDWDNNGSYTPGVFRNGTWLLRNSLSAGDAQVAVPYGRAGDVPVVGDWQGTGRTGLGVVRAGVWLLRNSVSGGTHDVAVPYGQATDQPVYGPAPAPPPTGPPPAVTPIEWSRFTNPPPADPDSELVADILRNTNRYALSTWWSSKGFDQQTGQYLSFGGTGEYQIRAPGNEAFALATSLRTGAYDADRTGVSDEEARRRAVRLAASLAFRHRSNSAGGWGSGWQSALWTARAGFAAWLLWEDLSTTDRGYVSRMVAVEADRLVNYVVPYYRDRSGTIVSPGDTKAEENAWNAMVLQLAVAMMPDHPNAQAWNRKNVELMVSAFARPADVDSGTVVNGRPVRDWLNGSNANDDGFLINHGFVHPDYSTTVAENIHAALTSSMGGQATPRGAFWGAEVVYDALVDHVWVAGSTYPPRGEVLPPGGTVYIDGSPRLYYPQGNDWGTDRYIQPLLLDVMARAFGFDRLASQQGDYWQRLHGQGVLNQQSRSSDGRTYLTDDEDTYPGREELVAVTAAEAYLTKWIIAQNAFRIGDGAV